MGKKRRRKLETARQLLKNTPRSNREKNFTERRAMKDKNAKKDHREILKTQSFHLIPKTCFRAHNQIAISILGFPLLHGGAPLSVV